MAKEIFSYKKIYIEDSPTMYRYKDTLKKNYFVKLNRREKVYTNDFELPEIIFKELQDYCIRNDFKYETKIVEEKDFENRYHVIYEFISYSETLFVIRKRKDKKEEYIINVYNYDYYSIVTIVECSSGNTLNLNLKDISYKRSIEIEILKQLYKIVDNYTGKLRIDNFIHIYSILCNQYQTNLTYQAKLNSFKYALFSKIKEKNQGGFLCNCVPGFAPDIYFTVVGDKIVSSLDGNFLSYSSEQKVLKYLYDKKNRKYIGVKKEPSLSELFLDRKISSNIGGYPTKALINKVEAVNINMIRISIFDGTNTYEIGKLFHKDELLQLIKNSWFF